MGFVHLHNRSQYSILDGAMRPGELVNRVTELEMGAVALTDTCNLYGAVEFYKAAKGAGVHPVFGSELWLWPEGIDKFDDRTSLLRDTKTSVRSSPTQSLTECTFDHGPIWHSFAPTKRDSLCSLEAFMAPWG
jgi:hypothetical protein